MNNCIVELRCHHALDVKGHIFQRREFSMSVISGDDVVYSNSDGLSDIAHALKIREEKRFDVGWRVLLVVVLDVLLEVKG